MRLEMVTPRGTALPGNAQQVEIEEITLPGVKGEFGILPGHTPFVSALKPGVLSYKERGGAAKKVFAIGAGFAEITGAGADGKVVVLARRAQAGGDVDAAEAQKELAEAENALKDFRPSPDQPSAGELEDRASWARARLDARASAGSSAK